MFKEYLNKIVTVTMDRKMGDKHPKYDWVYPINYGEIKGVKSGDGEDLDVYVIGPDKPLDTFEGKCVAYIQRKDNLEDPKLIVVSVEKENISDDEILESVNFQEKWFEPVVKRN
jgi:inorganic pyrophosphatase